MASNTEETSASSTQNEAPTSDDERTEDPGSAADENTNEATSSGGQTQKQTGPTYANSYLRVTKENLYMILALWMERFENEEPKPCRKVGAVLVLPNEVVFAMDCTRDGVHAAQRLLIKHYNKAKDLTVYLSRRPCSTCAKLLVQAKVRRVLYLQFEPEYYCTPKPKSECTTDEQRKERNEVIQSNNTQMKEVDNLFTASAIGQTKFVLQVEEAILDHVREKTPEEEEQKIQELKSSLVAEKYKTNWMSKMETVRDELPWSAYDEEMARQVREYFENAMEWIARVRVLSGKGLESEYDFENCVDKNEQQDKSFDPVKNPTHKRQAYVLMTIAKFLAQRTDDPKTGVGAVIVSWPKMQVLGLGWNGFPMKALYGDFARASKYDDTKEKKYPYSIHAEQNALLMRNTSNVEGAILFVTKVPCDECTPLIKMAGIKTVVVDDDKALSSGGISYGKFPNELSQGNFICFQTKPLARDKKKIAISQSKRRKIETKNNDS